MALAFFGMEYSAGEREDDRTSVGADRPDRPVGVVGLAGEAGFGGSTASCVR